MLGEFMIADISTVGERGQITIPKNIRDMIGITPKDNLLIKCEGERIYLERLNSKKERDKAMKEFYTKYSKLNDNLTKEFSSTLGDVNWK